MRIRKKKPIKSCLNCNKKFELKSNGPSHSKQKYCSRKCASISQRKYKDRSWSLECSKCGNITQYSSRENYRRAIRDKRTMCIPCRGKANRGLKRTKEQRKIISERTKESMQRPEVRDRFVSAVSSDEYREKKRVAFIKQRARCGDNVALYNETACKFFDELNRITGWSGKHATNGGEVVVGGFWLDYYEPNLNIVIEWDERHHRYKKKEDTYRAKYIVKKLGCKFFRIDEDTLEITEVRYE